MKTFIILWYDVVSQTKVDDMTITVLMSNPWSNFPDFLSGQPGYVASPTWLDGVADESLSATEPVGTGPFVYAEYNDGNNFRMTRNDSYWNSDADGNAYPYLDEIEFVVASFDRTFDYRKLQIGFDAIRAGARFIATNADPNSTASSEGVVFNGSITDSANTNVVLI